MQIDPKIPLLAVLIVGIIMSCTLSQLLDVTAGMAQEPISSTPIPTEPKQAETEPGSNSKFSSPYEDYTLTQGLHGFSYGHMAIDLSAGKGTKIKSPIKGVVTDNFVDGLGNTTLFIENERYRITLLHGDYTVAIGEEVKQGQTIGKESNNGYTTDLHGQSCAGRNCGYHTHLNVFDKKENKNINPLILLNP